MERDRLNRLARLAETASHFHSKTSYSNATPSGSFSSNQVSAASGIRKDLEVIGVSDLLARIHVDQHGHFNSSPKMLGLSFAGSLSSRSLSAHRAFRFSFAARS